MFKEGDLVRVKNPKDGNEPCWERDGYLWLVKATDLYPSGLLQVKSIATGVTHTFFSYRFERAPDHD